LNAANLQALAQNFDTPVQHWWTAATSSIPVNKPKSIFNIARKNVNRKTRVWVSENVFTGRKTTGVEGKKKTM
jgi:hypothetical protein